MASSINTGMLFLVYHKEVCLVLCFSYAHSLWHELENIHVSYADGATHVVCMSLPYVMSDITKSLNGGLCNIGAWCTLWGFVLNSDKT